MLDEVPPRAVKEFLFKMLMELNKILLDISMWNKCERIEYFGTQYITSCVTRGVHSRGVVYVIIIFLHFASVLGAPKTFVCSLCTFVVDWCWLVPFFDILVSFF